MEIVKAIADHFGDVCQIITCGAILIKPARDWIMGTEAIKEGQRCLLRAEIVRMYYRHKDDRSLREFEFKLLEQCYKAYKTLKGNSFIDHIYQEMMEWDIV